MANSSLPLAYPLEHPDTLSELLVLIFPTVRSSPYRPCHEQSCIRFRVSHPPAWLEQFRKRGGRPHRRPLTSLGHGQRWQLRYSILKPAAAHPTFSPSHRAPALWEELSIALENRC